MVESKNNRLVRVDCKSLHYHAYNGDKHLNTISSDVPLEPEFVEYFRVHTERVIADIEDPEVA